MTERDVEVSEGLAWVLLSAGILLFVLNWIGENYAPEMGVRALAWLLLSPAP